MAAPLPGLPQLKSILAKKDASGKFRYSLEDLESIYPLLLLQVVTHGDAESLVGAERKMLLGFAEKAGLKAGASPKDVQDAVAAYFKAHPPNAELLAEFHGVVRSDVLGAKMSQESGKAFAKFLGGSPRPAVRPSSQAKPAAKPDMVGSIKRPTRV